MRILLLCALVLSISGCVFYPKEANKQDLAAKCHKSMKTKKLVLELYENQMALTCGHSHNAQGNAGCVALFAALIPATSLVVSGSIVLVGNALHWLEYESQCRT